MKLLWKIILSLVTVTIPIFLLLTSIRILFNPLFLQVEYNTPGFPVDPYGFSQAERLKWSKLSVEYLLNDADITFLEQLTFDNGLPIYNLRELNHMQDVKNLLQAVIPVWIMIGIFILLIGFIAWQVKRIPDYGTALSTGGWTCLGLVSLIAVGVLLSFSTLFTGFHLMFFEGDTWLFYTSDTLIRLFPMRFWRDAFLFVGIISILGALAMIGIGKSLRKTHHMPNPSEK